MTALTYFQLLCLGQATCKHVHQVLTVANDLSAHQGAEIFKAVTENLLSVSTKYCLDQNCMEHPNLCWGYYKGHFSELFRVYK